ncbi:MAG: T9SS C-terminal target domain-containing protein [Ignavibacteria bacterium]|nr:T9SS C-terminal target domain-containing protein [Ignavibacteria bacterium]
MRIIFSIICIAMILAVSGISSAQTVDSTTLNSSSISGNVVLTRTTTYLMKGFNYIENGGSITIPAGTVIKGDFETKGTLIIKRGGQIFAAGTADCPIVFTSEKPSGLRNAGDWGGIIILGRAAINTATGVDSAEIEGFGAGLGPVYGGQPVVNNDNSGVFRYVRLEFPGVNLTGVSGNEINGLTMGGVGSGTTIEYVQVSYSGDDSFEWFGGRVNPKYLIAYKGLDDDWDCDNGFQGKIQYGLSVRDKDIADVSSSNGFEIDNNVNSPSNTNNPRTRPFFSNMTVVGPFETTGTVVNPLFQRGGHLRRNMQACIYNSIIMGWRVGIRFDGSGVISDANGGTVQLRTNIFSGNVTLADQTGGTITPDPVTFINNFNTSYAANTSVQLTNPFNIYPDPSGNNITNWIPAGGSPALSGADFTNANLSGFENVSYRGAFGTNNWTSNWAQFNPKNYTLPVPTDYNITVIAQGFYNGATLNKADTVRVYLRNNTNPYSIVDSAAAVINVNTFTGTFCFNYAPTGTYYLQVRQRNHLETWSKSGGESYTAGSVNSYNFTTSSSQAYGSNQILSGSKYCMYGGDVAGGISSGEIYNYQDGSIDAADLSAIDNDALNSLSGYYPSDVTGDDFVDSGDLSITDNNSLLSVFTARP